MFFIFCFDTPAVLYSRHFFFNRKAVPAIGGDGFCLFSGFLVALCYGDVDTKRALLFYLVRDAAFYILSYIRVIA